MGQTQTATNSKGINQLTDQVIAADLLIYAKTGVTMYAAAVTDASTPAIRTMLKKQLDQSIAFQEQLGAYISDRGWAKATDLNEQLKTDMKKAQETMDMLK